MTLTPGTRIGPYEILSPLSGVGLGEINRGRDHEQRRDVVIRALRIATDADPTLLSRLVADVLEAGLLSHPAIPQVYDVGRTPDTVYIVSEPFDGETLRALFDRGELTADAATECMAKVASALAVARTLHIPHGNLRAENVLLTSDGRTVVLGFGLAAMDSDGQSDEVAFDALRRDLLPEKPPVGSAPPWWRRSAAAVAVGLLLLAIGIAVTVTRTVQRAGQSPQASGGAADDALIPSGSAAEVFVPPPAQITEEAVVDGAPVPIPEVAAADADADAAPEVVSNPLEPEPAAAPEPPELASEAVADPLGLAPMAATEAPELASEAVADPLGLAPMAATEAPEPASEAVTNPLEATPSEGPEQSAEGDLPSSGGDEPLLIASDAGPPAPPLPEPVADAPPATPVVGADGRDARSLIAEAIVRAAEFDLPGAMELLRVTAARGDAGSEVGLVYLRGLVDAREAFEDGGTVADLTPVYGAIEALATLSQGRRGSAEIARFVLQAAAAAAQSERDEMRLYLETAMQMELIQSAAGLPGAPLVSATEIAGDLWLQVDRYEEARQMYDDAADRVGPSLRNMVGSARASGRLKDVLAACTSYGGLLETWGSRPGAPAEIAEAQTYIDTVCMSAEVPDVDAPG